MVIHGGPTAAARRQFHLGIQFWTSRGFAVVDVNYRGSTGYGRPFRDLLIGQWGVVDVEDCVAAATYLAERGDVDPARLAIRGGSAGGFTTLAALAFHDTFAAGASNYGVADLAVLAQETHKFESRYLDSLIGPWPEAEALYRERSPLFHADGIRVPLLVLQGLEDEVVPPRRRAGVERRRRARRGRDDEQLRSIQELLPEEWLAAAATGTAEECARTVLGQFDCGADSVILHGATPDELAPVVDAYRQLRPTGRFDALAANPGVSPVFAGS